MSPELIGEVLSVAMFVATIGGVMAVVTAVSGIAGAIERLFPRNVAQCAVSPAELRRARRLGHHRKERWTHHEQRRSENGQSHLGSAGRVV